MLSHHTCHYLAKVPAASHRWCNWSSPSINHPHIATKELFPKDSSDHITLGQSLSRTPPFLHWMESRLPSRPINPCVVWLLTASLQLASHWTLFILYSGTPEYSLLSHPATLWCTHSLFLLKCLIIPGKLLLIQPVYEALPPRPLASALCTPWACSH